MPLRPRSVLGPLAALLLLLAAVQLLYLWLLPGPGPGARRRAGPRRLQQPGLGLGLAPGPGPGLGLSSFPLARGSHLDPSGRYRLYRDVGRSGLGLGLGPGPGLELELGLATHTSVHNLYQLPALLRRWQGPAAVALFAPADEVPQALLALRALQQHCPGVRRTVTFTLVTPSGVRLPPASASAPPPSASHGEQEEHPRLESDAEPEPHPPCRRALAPLHRLRLRRRNYALGNASYPNNLLRNAARQALPSRYALVIDMDMLPSGGLHSLFLEFLRAGGAGPPPPADDRTLFVLPALEIRHSRRVPWDKAELQRLYQVAEVRPFYAELCPRCQAPTNYSRWINLPAAGGPGLRVAYTRRWTDPWEPFYIARATVPAYDERFEQYGFNRISQACELHVAGYTFAVLDNAFLVHKGFKLASEFHPQKDEENRRNRILFRQFKQELKAKYPDSPRRC